MPISIATHKKRRDIAQASLTRIQTKVTDLEGDSTQPSTAEAAKQLLSKLEKLDADFKEHHLAIVDQTSEDSLEAEQELLDRHDDEVADLSVRTRMYS